jgi:tRNA A-37 threonylcarbamoyl transferase component Bud32
MKGFRKIIYKGANPFYPGFKKKKIDTTVKEWFKDPTKIKSIHYLPGHELPPVSEWEALGSSGSLTSSFFKLPNGEEVVLKRIKFNTRLRMSFGEEMYGSKIRDLMKAHRELKKRGFIIEKPIGVIETEKSRFYVTKRIKGKKLNKRLKDVNVRDQKRIMITLAKKMADMHDKGIYHMHLSVDNILVDKITPHIIDMKLVAFESQLAPIKPESIDINTAFRMDTADLLYGIKNELGNGEELERIFKKAYEWYRKGNYKWYKHKPLKFHT